MRDPDTVRELTDALKETQRGLRQSIANNSGAPELYQAFVNGDEKLQKALDEVDWIYDPVAANKDARTHVRPKHAPPHWVRCDFVRNGVRCVKGEGHEKGFGEQAKHEGPKT